ncbi:zona pellucida sperm-binding protein 1-like [Ambystoma mexicanum]|uniref:zona pellucida sperm-binding protein 1-like n=1 Tax=Ambystoma mexicanum TaxID=8296 RepID=UPI0037E74D74
MRPACSFWLLAVWPLILAPGAEARSVLKVRYDCGEQGLQLVASLDPWPPGDRVVFKILDEFNNAKAVEDCWACQHWVSTGPQGEAVLTIQYNGCYVFMTNDKFHLKVRVLQMSESPVPSLSQDVDMLCPKMFHGDSSRQLPQPWEAVQSPTPHQQASPSTPGSSMLARKPGTNITNVCQVDSGKIRCGVNSSTSMDACLGAGCCYDPTDQTAPCYYGNKANVQCSPDGFFTVVVSRDMLHHSILLDKVHFADSSPACRPQVSTESFRLFRFPLNQCGTTVQLLGDRVVYGNEMKYAIDVQHSDDGSITRDTAFMLYLRCSYSTSDSIPVMVEVLTLPPPLPIEEAGPLRLEMRIAKDAMYSSYYSEEEYPVVKILRDPIFLEVRLLQRTDPSLKLVLEQCWAAQTANPLQEPQWPVLRNGCPFAGDDYPSSTASMASTLQFPSHYSRFTVATFTFVGSASPLTSGGQVFFFCSASVCHLSPSEFCTPLCPPPRARRKRFVELQMHPTKKQSVNLAISQGPVILQEKPIVERKKGSMPLPATTPPLVLGWLPMTAGVATGMAVSLLALAVVFWRKIGEAVFAWTIQD